jgi:hypothetical protein
VRLFGGKTWLMRSWLERHPLFGFDSPRFGPMVSGFSLSGPNLWSSCWTVCVAAGSEYSLLYHFALSRGPRVVFQRIPINIRVLFTLVTEGAPEFWFSLGWMILTGENRSIRRKTYPSATSSTTNPVWTCLESNSVSIGKRYRTGTALYSDMWRHVL